MDARHPQSHPACLTVRSLDPMLGIDGAVAVHRVPEERGETLTVVGMHGVEPQIPEQVTVAPARDLAHPLVDEHVAEGGDCGEQTHGSVVGEGQQLGLTEVLQGGPTGRARIVSRRVRRQIRHPNPVTQNRSAPTAQVAPGYAPQRGGASPSAPLSARTRRTR